MREREKTVGWKLERGERAALLERLKPAYANFVAPAASDPPAGNA